MVNPTLQEALWNTDCELRKNNVYIMCILWSIFGSQQKNDILLFLVILHFSQKPEGLNYKNPRYPQLQQKIRQNFCQCMSVPLKSSHGYLRMNSQRYPPTREKTCYFHFKAEIP